MTSLARAWTLGAVAVLLATQVATAPVLSIGVGEPSGSVVELQVGGREGVPTDASAAVLNVTVDAPQGDGFATVWPCGEQRPLASNLNYHVGQTIANLVIARLGTGGKVCIFVQTGTHVIADVSGYFPAGSDYVPIINPVRLLDTRDGTGGVAGAVPSESVVELQVGGREGVPTDALAAVLNVTVDAPQGDGFATVWPCGERRPPTSNLNFQTGRTIANLVVSRLGTGGKVCIFVQTGTHVIADVSGYFPAGSDYVAITNPARVIDILSILCPAIGCGPLYAFVELQVGGRQGVPTDASAAVLNVTVDHPQGDGFATVWPCGEQRPLASNLNYHVGQTIANPVIARLGTGGKVCIFVDPAIGARVIADVSGYFPAGSDYVPIINPVRLLDTRDGTGT